MRRLLSLDIECRLGVSSNLRQLRRKRGRHTAGCWARKEVLFGLLVVGDTAPKTVVRQKRIFPPKKKKIDPLYSTAYRCTCTQTLALCNPKSQTGNRIELFWTAYMRLKNIRFDFLFGRRRVSQQSHACTGTLEE